MTVEQILKLASELSLSEQQRLLEQIAHGGYSTVSEYIRELIRLDKKRKAQDHLETLLLESLESGQPTEMTQADWDDIRKTVRDKMAKHSK